VGDPCSPSRYVGPIEFAKQPSPALHPASPARFAKVVCSGAVEESLLEPDLELRLPSYLFFRPPTRPILSGDARGQYNGGSEEQKIQRQRTLK
jgi:hypothetical protein